MAARRGWCRPCEPSCRPAVPTRAVGHDSCGGRGGRPARVVPTVYAASAIVSCSSCAASFNRGSQLSGGGSSATKMFLQQVSGLALGNSWASTCGGGSEC